VVGIRVKFKHLVIGIRILMKVTGGRY